MIWTTPLFRYHDTDDLDVCTYSQVATFRQARASEASAWGMTQFSRRDRGINPNRAKIREVGKQVRAFKPSMGLYMPLRNRPTPQPKNEKEELRVRGGELQYILGARPRPRGGASPPPTQRRAPAGRRGGAAAPAGTPGPFGRHGSGARRSPLRRDGDGHTHANAGARVHAHVYTHKHRHGCTDSHTKAARHKMLSRYGKRNRLHKVQLRRHV